MRQLHASDSHGVERRREVVVRPDGSKVIRVEKRRRTYSDDQREPNRGMLKNKRFLIGLCILVLLAAGCAAGTGRLFPHLADLAIFPGGAEDLVPDGQSAPAGR